MNVKTSKRLLFVVNFDWRNIFQTGKEEFYEKLQRDQLSPEVNEFFFFSFSFLGQRKPMMPVMESGVPNIKKRLALKNSGHS